MVVIGGPTASGKNKLALAIASRLDCEIVNADSRQIYRDLKIGTNHPTTDEMKRVPHHLFGHVHPASQFSAADYEKSALSVVEAIRRRQRIPLIVGGTGFYIKALLKGVWPVPPKDPVLRARLQDIGVRHGNPFLHTMLRRMDPASADRIAANDTYRVIRAIEITFQSGEKASHFRAAVEDRFPALKFYIDPPREILLKNINERVEMMFAAGWIEEVKDLLERYPGFQEMPAAASLGYRQIFSFLDLEIDLKDCQETIALQTAQYAKRQITWFRNQDRFMRLDSDPLVQIIDSVLQLEE